MYPGATLIMYATEFNQFIFIQARSQALLLYISLFLFKIVIKWLYLKQQSNWSTYNSHTLWLTLNVITLFQPLYYEMY